jgi:NADPH:quinone reductase-like Zn-dependent oxidoreductase
VTALEFMGGRFHALCNKTFQLWVHRAVVLAHNVPARLRSPRRSFKLLVEEVRVRHALGRPNKFLLLLRQISREARNATCLQPDAIISNFNVTEDVCARKFLLQALRRLVGIRCECADVDQRGNAFIVSRDAFVWIQPNGNELAEIAALIDSGNLKVVLDRILPLSEARRAHELSQSGHARGKIVLRVKED